jgi:hypothetical protein
VDVPSAAAFWATVLGRTVNTRADGSHWLSGETPAETVWINRVDEPKDAKNRVHLDVFAPSVDAVALLGARPVEDFPHWTVMQAPDGQEFCVFVRDVVPGQRLKDLVVDSCDPEPIAQWWCSVFGGVLGRAEDNPWWWVDAVAGAPFESIDFVEVPEPKSVKNRVHWDVSVNAVQDLLDVGATLLRAKGEDIGWHVLADPDGNEFCAFESAEPAPEQG